MSAPFCSHGWLQGDCPYCKVQQLELQVEELQKFIRKVADVTPERYAAFGAQAFMALPREATALLANEVKRKCDVTTTEGFRCGLDYGHENAHQIQIGWNS